MWTYKNGNYTVLIKEDGSKYRLSDHPKPIFPENMDIKITDECDGGCEFCHENSTITGKSFNVETALKLLKPLPTGVEFAIGGGNPLVRTHDLIWLKRKLGCYTILNITVNAQHLNGSIIEKINPTAVGISYNPTLHGTILSFCKEYSAYQPVIHLVIGVHTLKDFERCLLEKDFPRILILGYKEVGRGKLFYNKTIEKRIKEWRENAFKCLTGTKTIAFDNLAIEQTNVGRFIARKRWDEMYMGTDGEFSMYLDLVKMEYARSSRHVEKFPIKDLTIKEMFQNIRTITQNPNRIN